MNTLARRLRCERGDGLISALLLLTGVLLPLLFIVPLFARIEQGRLAAEQAARDAVRAAVQAPTALAADAAAASALARARAQTGEALELTLSGSFDRGALLRAEARAAVPLASLPLFGSVGTVVVRGKASAPVDRYRSLIDGGGQ